MSGKSEWAEVINAHVDQRNAVKALVGQHADLKARVVTVFSQNGTAMVSYDQWTGYVPVETVNKGGVERPNTSPIRLALVEVVHEARSRYAEANHGEVPW